MDPCCGPGTLIICTWPRPIQTEWYAMNDFQRKTQTQSTPSVSGALKGEPPCEAVTTRPDKDQTVRRERDKWLLRRQKVIFYYALVCLPFFFAGSVWALSVECPPEVKIIAGCFLASAALAFVRLVTGITPPLLELLSEVIRAWLSRR